MTRTEVNELREGQRIRSKRKRGKIVTVSVVDKTWGTVVCDDGEEFVTLSWRALTPGLDLRHWEAC